MARRCTTSPGSSLLRREEGEERRIAKERERERERERAKEEEEKKEKQRRKS